MPRHSTRKTMTERFWSKVNKTDSCWLWTDRLSVDGYGRISYSGTTRMIFAHRYSYELAHGPIPADLVVRHRCDVRHCVNPDHLTIGTPADNLADTRARGRLVAGSYVVPQNDRKTMEDRLWAMVNVTDTCWLWTGAVTVGYGRLNYPGTHRFMLAHRYSYELVHGPIPDGLFVLHRCDTPRCVRPDHLFLGTQADNMADATAKGRRGYGARNGKYTMPERTPRGEQVGTSKLTADQVREIRRRYAAGGIGQRALAKAYGVVKSTIRHIVRRMQWKDID